jgi:hypothetical protein
MRTIGQARKALDMMCERALSRTTQGSLLADKQFVQGSFPGNTGLSRSQCRVPAPVHGPNTAIAQVRIAFEQVEGALGVV